jgi:cell wall-associated NlpC family hydrolase
VAPEAAPTGAPLASFDIARVQSFLDACRNANPRVTYGLGAKVPFHGAVPGRDFTQIDCSGFVREAIRLASNPSIPFPDGSVVQHDWVRAHGFERSSATAGSSTDGAVRIAFLRPQDTQVTSVMSP